MKKTFLLAAVALFAAYGCENDPPAPPVKDDISVSPQSKAFDSAGGEVSVMVSSTGDWTLSGNYDWVTPSVKSGKSEDTVKFTVSANDGEGEKKATFTFTCGDATAPFTVTLAGKNVPQIKFDLLTDENMEVPNTKGQIEIQVDSEVSYREITNEIAFDGEDTDWLTYVTAIAGDGDIAKLYFDVKANESFVDRSATITITGDTASVEVNVKQKQTDKLNVDQTAVFIFLDGDTFDVNVDANVPYDVVIPDEDQAWLSQVQDGSKHTFTAAAGTEQRSTTVNFVSEDGAITKPVMVTQKPNALINMAASLVSNRAWPVWTNDGQLRNMTEFTMECLVYANSFNKTQSPLNVIMGIEGQFQIRTGDVGVPQGQIQVCVNQKYKSGTTTSERKATGANLTLTAGKWYHIAATYSKTNSLVEVYLDGVKLQTVAPQSSSYEFPGVDVGTPHNDESGMTITRCFWAGYGYEASRYWPGMVSEMRIWNKVLTNEEINAANHFYTVPADSEGLVAYWKFDDGQPGTTDVIKDYTANANHMSCDKAIDWKVVSVPTPVVP